MKNFKVKEKISKMIKMGNTKLAVSVAAFETGLVTTGSIVAKANEVTPSSGVIDQSILDAVGAGFNTILQTVTSVLVIAVPSTVAIIGVTEGVKFALKKAKGAINQAS